MGKCFILISLFFLISCNQDDAVKTTGDVVFTFDNPTVDHAGLRIDIKEHDGSYQTVTYFGPIEGQSVTVTDLQPGDYRYDYGAITQIAAGLFQIKAGVTTQETVNN